jgi:Tc toxin complex TcA C-terminal TcB-binding domain/PKD domain
MPNVLTNDQIGKIHEQLVVMGYPINPDEQTAATFGIKTLNAVRAFQERYKLPLKTENDNTATVDLPTTRLMKVVSTFATSTGRAALSNAIKEVNDAATDSDPQELYWLTRYAIISGNYDLAKKLNTQLNALPNVQGRFGGLEGRGELPDRILDTGESHQPKAPDAQFPENFYSYRYDLMAQEDIAQLKVSRKTIAGNTLLPVIVANRERMGSSNRSADTGNPSSREYIDDQFSTHLPDLDLPAQEESQEDRIKEENRLINSALAWLDAIEAWQSGNAEFSKRRYAGAIDSYNRCQVFILSYFEIYYGLKSTATSLADRIEELVFQIASDRNRWSDLWLYFDWRRQLLSLAELRQFDWHFITNLDVTYTLLKANLNGTEAPGLGSRHRKYLLEARLIVMATVLVPLARAEANRSRRQYKAALEDIALCLRNEVSGINPTPTQQTIPALLKCEYIEVPFAKALWAEILLEQAEAQYKARQTVDNETVETLKAAQLKRIGEMKADFETRKIPGNDKVNETKPFQHLVAALTYDDVFNAIANIELSYVTRTQKALVELNKTVDETLKSGETNSKDFRSLGLTVTFESFKPTSAMQPGMELNAGPHESFLTYNLPEGQEIVRERNPRIYALLLQAQARLLQIWSGFNYLGYSDEYVPPWRFPFLLDRARYFAEHAKNAQRDYLNFLSNAEREDFQELSASQNVVMEKSNVQIETARVEQVKSEIEVAKQGKELAELAQTNALTRLTNYENFDQYADNRDWVSRVGMGVGIAGGIMGGILGAVKGGGLLGGIAGGLTSAGAAIQQEAQLEVAGEQRELEKKNLKLAKSEAEKSAKVAGAQFEASKSSLIVAGLQRQAALFRHEFAIQNLQFLRNRVLDAEQWYRLTAGIRSVSETYLRYAVELAFLAEQAYEFEADKRLNVIRFDYDISEVGDFLAADFLMRDLDTLEQDLIVTQQQRQQQVRYVLSMAREFPAALQDLRDSGKTTFSLQLEQLEKRFPGLYNLRIGAVDILPIALMDSTRFSLELTHLGTSVLRLKAQDGKPNDDPNKTEDWLDLEDKWPVRLRYMGRETSVFSGLSRQDANAIFQFFSNNQRHAFEDLGAASAWQVDFSTPENQMVPDSLADLLFTFTLSGYHDPDLRKAIDGAIPATNTLTSFLSARQNFPDAFYDFNRTGRMVWKVSREMLTLADDLGRLRNIGFSLRPAASGIHFSRLMSRVSINFSVQESGLEVHTPIPDSIKVEQTAPLSIIVSTTGSGMTFTWDFGDGTAIVANSANSDVSHVYAKPGRFVITLRCVKDNALTEYRMSVVASRNHKLGNPLIVLPNTTIKMEGDKVKISGKATSDEASRKLWQIDGKTVEGDNFEQELALKHGNYSLSFAAVRKLTFRAYSHQRYDPSQALTLTGLTAATNRTEATSSSGSDFNPLAKLFFEKGEISPQDDWYFELLPEEILGLEGGAVIGTEQLDLSGIQDVVLSMEYDVTPVKRQKIS